MFKGINFWTYFKIALMKICFYSTWGYLKIALLSHDFYRKVVAISFLSLKTIYRKFGNFREGFIFAKKMRNFKKINPSRNGEITLLFTDVGKSGHSFEFLTSQIPLLTLFAKIKFSQKFPDLQ